MSNESPPRDVASGSAPLHSRAWGWSRLSLKGKILTVTGASVAFVSFILVALLVMQMRTMLLQALRDRGHAVGVGLSNNLAFSIFSKDKAGLKAAADATLSDINDVAYIIISSAQGDVLAKAMDPRFKAEVAPEKAAAYSKIGDREARYGGSSILEVLAPVNFEESQQGPSDATLDPLAVGAEPAGAKTHTVKQVGIVQVGFKLDELNAQVSMASFKALALGVVVSLLCLLSALILARRLIAPLEQLAQAAAGIARGDLRQGLSLEGDDEIAVLARSFETMTQGLRRMLSDLKAAAGQMGSQAELLLANATQQSAMTSEQAAALVETNTTVKEIAQTSTLATDQADGVIKVTQKAEEFAQEGQAVIQQTITGMENLDHQVRAIAETMTELTERTVEIADIISTVKDLAERSDMLALNASIEAAKAGEHGRGFSVVAMEMRNLAEQSARAAGEVRRILGEVQKVTRAAVSATEEGSKRAQSMVALAQTAGSAISRLGGVSQESSVSARQIAGNTRQQTTGVEQIVEALSELSGATSETVRMTQDIERAAGELKTLSGHLTNLVTQYKA
jgi:methyl-accepting chemotaxis protein